MTRPELASLCCGCHCPVRGGSAPWKLEWKSPDLSLGCVSDPQCEVGPLEGKLLSIPPLELFTCCMSFRLHCCWGCFEPHLNYGYACNWPWCLSDVVFTGPPAQIHWSQVPGFGTVIIDLDPLCALWEQLRLWSGSTPMCTCLQSLQLLKLYPSWLWEHLLFF